MKPRRDGKRVLLGVCLGLIACGGGGPGSSCKQDADCSQAGLGSICLSGENVLYFPDGGETRLGSPICASKCIPDPPDPRGSCPSGQYCETLGDVSLMSQAVVCSTLAN